MLSVNPIIYTLPDNALLSIKEISSYTGVNEVAIQSRHRRGSLPVPIKLGRTFSNKAKLFWKVKEVRNNLELFCQWN